jgi:hypothetical protein
MTKDEILKLALEALEGNTTNPVIDPDQAAIEDQAINAIKQALALDKKAENAREFGLDYDPAGGTQVSKVWWDGEKMMVKPIPLEDIYPAAQPSDIRNATLDEIAGKIALMPFGDTAASFAVWIKEQKT